MMSGLQTQLPSTGPGPEYSPSGSAARWPHWAGSDRPTPQAHGAPSAGSGWSGSKSAAPERETQSAQSWYTRRRT